MTRRGLTPRLAGSPPKRSIRRYLVDDVPAIMYAQVGGFKDVVLPAGTQVTQIDVFQGADGPVSDIRVKARWYRARGEVRTEVRTRVR